MFQKRKASARYNNDGRNGYLAGGTYFEEQVPVSTPRDSSVYRVKRQLA